MQTMARKNEWPLDKTCLTVDVTKKTKEDYGHPPREGAYLHGLFMEGKTPQGVSGEPFLTQVQIGCLSSYCCSASPHSHSNLMLVIISFLPLKFCKYIWVVMPLNNFRLRPNSHYLAFQYNHFKIFFLLFKNCP